MVYLIRGGRLARINYDGYRSASTRLVLENVGKNWSGVQNFDALPKRQCTIMCLATIIRMVITLSQPSSPYFHRRLNPILWITGL